METVYIDNGKKIYNHVRRHKGKYITGGLCLMVGGLVGAVLSISKKVDVAFDTLKVLKSTRSRLAPYSDDVIATGRSLINHIGRNGHPGNVIYCNETKQLFKSHREATRVLGIDSRDLWAYLKGLKPNARGFTFTTIGEAKDLKSS